MSTSFAQLLTDCLVALGDSAGTTWSRTTVIWPWCIEAMKTFPILRPMKDDHTNGAAVVYSFAAAADFRYVISVEYPINQTPPTYLVRKNRLDPSFYRKSGFYDIDHDYATGSGWIIYVSGGIAALAHIYVQYLANHDVAMADDAGHLITVPDEYENVLIAQVICRAYRERLGYFMQNPTAQTNVIMRVTDMVQKAEDSYNALLAAAQKRLADSRVTGDKFADKFDRVY
jgi:hypothetical protein